jgi:hypothetical protein
MSRTGSAKACADEHEERQVRVHREQIQPVDPSQSERLLLRPQDAQVVKEKVRHDEGQHADPEQEDDGKIPRGIGRLRSFLELPEQE